MSGTGLKKCKPPNLSLRFTGSAIFSIDRDDVFEVKSALLQIEKKTEFQIEAISIKAMFAYEWNVNTIQTLVQASRAL
jgi:hypothetical protein